HMFRLFAMAVDMNFVRIGQAKDTGKDPGEIDPTTGGGLPPALRALLKKITGHGPSGPTSDPGNLDSI
ncbi:MAG TPA: hypothetical protein PKL84_08420, partial [Candidatus Hydrogenedentes bacterium]|nr:hypothetical protein [Candidatus Hydrogenedentota bacterium]